MQHHMSGADRHTVRLKAIAAGVLILAAASGIYWYLRPPQTLPIQTAIQVEPVGTIVQLAPNLYVVPGGGSNTGVFVMRTGVLVVDTKYRRSWDGLIGEIRKVTDKPITHVINSHAHRDHSEGNVMLPATAQVVVQANNLASLREEMRSDGSEAVNRLGRSPVEFDDKLTLFDGDDGVDTYFFGPAHTNGDSVIVFRSARVMFVGDLMPAKRLPSIVIGGGGNGATFADVVAQATSIRGVDRVVTGHGPVVTWQEFVDYGELHQLIREYVRASMRFGSDKNEVFRSFQPPAKFKDYDFRRKFATLDEVDTSLRPRWKRVWPWTR